MPRPDPHRPQSERQGVQAVANAHAAQGPDELGPLMLERFEFRAQDERAAGHHAPQRLVEFGLGTGVDRGHVEESDPHAARVAPGRHGRQAPSGAGEPPFLMIVRKSWRSRM